MTPIQGVFGLARHGNRVADSESALALDGNLPNALTAPKGSKLKDTMVNSMHVVARQNLRTSDADGTASLSLVDDACWAYRKSHQNLLF